MQTKGNVLFGESFFDDYAVSLITHPDIALIELVANSWDAGASNVNISWPTEVDGEFKIEDHVIRSNGKLPWNILKGTESGKDGHGTELSARLVNSKAYLPVNKIKELIG